MKPRTAPCKERVGRRECHKETMRGKGLTSAHWVWSSARYSLHLDQVRTGSKAEAQINGRAKEATLEHSREFNGKGRARHRIGQRTQKRDLCLLRLPSTGARLRAGSTTGQQGRKASMPAGNTVGVKDGLSPRWLRQKSGGSSERGRQEDWAVAVVGSAPAAPPRDEGTA